MPRWLRVLRGMIGTGLTFSVGVGLAASAVAGIAVLLPGVQGSVEMIRVVVASAMWAFPIGFVASGALALTSRNRTFETLSLPRFAALGAGAGLLAFGLLAANAWQAWSVTTAITNASILVLLGSGGAAGTLLLARRATPELEAGGEPNQLSDPAA